MTEYYEWNGRNMNHSLYMNRALYVPDVVFEHDERRLECDVIVCAAPNKNAAQKYNNVTDKENDQVLDERIRFILDMAAVKRADTLILGAFGCGVFGQDAERVGEIFRKYLSTSHKCFVNTVFAVPFGKNNNYGNLKKGLTGTDANS